MNRYIFPENERESIESSAIPYAVFQFIDGRVLSIACSEGMCELFGYDRFDLSYHDMDNNMYKDTHSDDAARIENAAHRFAVEGGKFDVIYRTKNKHGDGYKIIHAQGVHKFTKTGERLAYVWYTDEGLYYEESGSTKTMLDRTLKDALFESSFVKATYFDHLTGLPSMTYFFELALSAKQNMENRGHFPAVMFIDLSGMKYYNQKYGFSRGDDLLRSLARLLAQQFGNENCCRLGQDHFVALTEEPPAESALDDLFAECAKLNDGNSLPIHVGVYPRWDDELAASAACDRAKIACDTLKNEHSSCFNYYDEKMRKAEEDHQYIIANIDRAVEERWIKVYYQPIVRAVNGRVCEEEALARWIDPVKGFMSPGDFIPILEQHKLIYKLDLYIVENVLKKIKIMTKAGLHVTPQSINLSRSDFDCCDIVEEIRRRVDDEGIDHSMLTIEITESVIGRDLDFMKSQIERFKALGFAVWMDDFGSGYSSLDVLQNIGFDLIKFDMRFLQQFHQSVRSRVILTEMLRMAASLGIETVCEGVETEEQSQFLRETGCTKLQGYLFQKPIPVEKILEKYAKGIQIGFENPDELPYYEAIGRVNLHDLTVIAQGDRGEFSNVFNMIPMAVLEVCGNQVRYVRSNQTYRDFMQQHFGNRITDHLEPYRDKPDSVESQFMKTLKKTHSSGLPIFIDDTLPNGTRIQSCVRCVANNHVTGAFATAIAVLSVTDGEKGTTYSNIAQALAADYFNLYYVDIDSENFYEYTAEAGDNDLSIKRHEQDFFRRSREDAINVIHPDDVEMFNRAFTKENILANLDENGYFNISYRLMVNGGYHRVNMKAMRMQHDPGHLIIGVNNSEQK